MVLRIEQDHAWISPGAEPSFYPSSRLRAAENIFAAMVILSGFGLFAFPRSSADPIMTFRWQVAYLLVFIACVVAICITCRLGYFRSFIYIDDQTLEFNLSYGNDPRGTVLLMLDDIAHVNIERRRIMITTREGTVVAINRRIMRTIKGYALIEARFFEIMRAQATKI